MVEPEYSVEFHLDEVIDQFDKGSAAHGITAVLLNNDVDLSALSPAQKQVWDSVIWPSVKRNQDRHAREHRALLMRDDR